MDVDEPALQQFIVEQTGFSLDRVANVLRRGTPWPVLTAIADLMSQIDHDVDATKAELHTVAAAHVAMQELGGDDQADRNAIADHILRTATLAHEEPDVVHAVSSAMLTFYGQRAKENEEKWKALGKKMTDEGLTR